MNRLDTRFAALKAQGERALVVFVTAGDPYPERTVDVLCALAEAGADVIELGVPFSDPLADGPTIQAASFRALQGGMNPPKVLAAVREARARGVSVPIVLMGAYNPVLQYGPEKFAQDAVAAGVDGAIVTDVIPEEADTWKPIADAAGLATIFLLAPTSTTERMEAVGKLAAGFIYCVSMTGITGTKEVVPSELPSLVAAIRQHAGTTPVCVGFGIKTPEQVKAICAFADGAVVGSSLVTLLHETRENPEALDVVKAYVASLKEATR
ncbi:tryptophan synthase subunit alpha [Armatimonas rosea]|uniref:Tryptophan synthase alpha chain n=1 Tax=Armatimonas rosea TaxID=685828 RepID=A0A7W9SL32_ARMRO|nr:tryptophan synthase subunit alpha [Armatimonas rosea]MBB6048606.1 tryptophan synthase alpha chain [Armatimonas rosea]